jgi:hypothetical protein
MELTWQIADRRDFLKASGAVAAAACWPALAGRSAEPGARRRMPVAAVVTIYFRRSHTDVIVGKILEGWRHDGGAGPDLELVSMYVEQVGASDLSQMMAGRHGFHLAKNIDDAITLGTDQVQVEGVISIGEHGAYPTTWDTLQPMYPRRRFFDGIIAAFERGGRVAPVFNDKHLAYRWEDAKYMYDTARDRGIPLLAGSSVPLAWRVPAFELDRGVELESALTIGYSELEIYGIHALEAHQALIERRGGGETGIAAVQALRGDAIRRAAADGRWPVDLFHAALDTLPGRPRPADDWTSQRNAAVYMLEHVDGLRSAVVMLGERVEDFAFAARLKGQSQPVATWIRLQNYPPFGHFAQQLKAIEETFHGGRAVYPVERTLLTSGTLDRLMHSLAQDGQRFETPELAIAYTSTDWPFANRADTRLKLPDPQ